MISKNKKFSIIFTLLLMFNVNNLYSDERLEAVIDQMQIINQDLKTLEKAFYKKSDILETSKTTNINNLNEDVLTKHLLRLNEIEEQFRSLTNKFEEISFKMDKLSSRVTKIQSDTQLRFSDLENSEIKPNTNKKKAKFARNKQAPRFWSNARIFT